MPLESDNRLRPAGKNLSKRCIAYFCSVCFVASLLVNMGVLTWLIALYVTNNVTLDIWALWVLLVLFSSISFMSLGIILRICLTSYNWAAKKRPPTSDTLLLDSQVEPTPTDGDYLPFNEQSTLENGSTLEEHTQSGSTLEEHTRENGSTQK